MKNKLFNSHEVVVEACHFADESMQLLLSQLEWELLQIYPDMPKPATLQPQLALIARLDAKPLGCVALLPFSEGVAEIKRLFIVSSVRGHGLARRLLTELEQQAAQQGIRRMLVETGDLQPAAISLYQRMGYQPIAPYGPYIGNPVSRCFEKWLAAA
ncbi:GNAT family N-acetyltransferase [Methylobacillus arboreus]|uniref:GNAT family N-acetyltransferase n=1 Tax=Methylobacillus arboreus TaxID=755170 RepID=UPI001E5B5ED6|nr:GNAT family N-acetyltransferase [Methylobacillus arboreus]MCB5190999.1 GNAT family N-acetyltransferase [Methylobacillus arboreus]